MDKEYNTKGVAGRKEENIKKNESFKKQLMYNKNLLHSVQHGDDITLMLVVFLLTFSSWKYSHVLVKYLPILYADLYSSIIV